MADDSSKRLNEMRQRMLDQQREMRSEQLEDIREQRQEVEEARKSWARRSFEDMVNSRKAAMIAAGVGVYAAARTTAGEAIRDAVTGGVLSSISSSVPITGGEAFRNRFLGGPLNTLSLGMLYQNRNVSLAMRDRMPNLFEARSRDITQGITNSAMATPIIRNIANSLGQSLGIESLRAESVGKDVFQKDLIKRLEFLNQDERDRLGLGTVGGRLDMNSAQIGVITEKAFMQQKARAAKLLGADSPADLELQNMLNQMNALGMHSFFQDRGRVLSAGKNIGEVSSKYMQDFTDNLLELTKGLAMSIEEIENITEKASAIGLSGDDVQAALLSVSRKIQAAGGTINPTALTNRVLDMQSQGMQQGFGKAAFAEAYTAQATAFDPLKLNEDTRTAYGVNTDQQRIALGRIGANLGESNLAKVLTYGHGSLEGFNKRLQEEGPLGYLKAQYDDTYLKDLVANGPGNVLKLFDNLGMSEPVKVAAIAKQAGVPMNVAKDLIDAFAGGTSGPMTEKQTAALAAVKDAAESPEEKNLRASKMMMEAVQLLVRAIKGSNILDGIVVASPATN